MKVTIPHTPVPYAPWRHQSLSNGDVLFIYLSFLAKACSATSYIFTAAAIGLAADVPCNDWDTLFRDAVILKSTISDIERRIMYLRGFQKLTQRKYVKIFYPPDKC